MKTLLRVVTAYLVFCFSGSLYAGYLPYAPAKSNLTASNIQSSYQYNKINVSSDEDEDYQSNNDDENANQNDNDQENNSDTQNQKDGDSQDSTNENNDTQENNDNDSW